MKRYTLLAIILFVATSALAQTLYDLSARNVEPARPRLIPYNNMAGAIKGDASQSRFVAEIDPLSRDEEGSVTTFSTSYVLPIAWLNRQVILRVGYASAAYTVYVNNNEVGYVPAGTMGAELNITKASQEGVNAVAIKLDKASAVNKLYEPKEIKVEQVEIFAQPTIRMRDYSVSVTLNAQGDGVAEFAVPVKCNALNRKEARMYYALRLNDTTLLTEGYREIALDMRREDTIRFACVVPAKALWSSANPTMARLDLESRIDNRIVECLSSKVGLRQLTLKNKKLYVNGSEVALNLVEWNEIKSLDKAQKKGYNGIIVTLDNGAYSIIEECAERGFYVVVRTPIDTTLLGDDIKRGGNPSNDPLWNESYLWRNIHSLNSTKSNCAVIGYAIAKGKTSGINIYDSYLLMKSLVPNHLIIYEGAAGEWATDK